MVVGSLNAPRSTSVIWPILSAWVIRDSRSSTRCSIGSAAFRYGRPLALMTTFGVAVGTSAVVLVSLMPMVSACSAAASVRTLTGHVCTGPGGGAGREGRRAARRLVVAHRRARPAAGGVAHGDRRLRRLAVTRGQLD